MRGLVVAAALVSGMSGMSPDIHAQKASPRKSANQTSKPKTHTVTIEGTGFQPASLMVKPGDTVVWINKDPFPHTATSKAGGFDSGQIAAGKSWKFTIPRTWKGEFEYICTLHPTMKASLRAE